MLLLCLHSQGQLQVLGAPMDYRTGREDEAHLQVVCNEARLTKVLAQISSQTLASDEVLHRFKEATQTTRATQSHHQTP